MIVYDLRARHFKNIAREQVDKADPNWQHWHSNVFTALLPPTFHPFAQASGVGSIKRRSIKDEHKRMCEARTVPSAKQKDNF